MTNIEWTDETWNPVTGCDKVSPGCKFCYAEGIADRFFAKQYPPNEDGSPRKFTDVRCHVERLEEPLHWKKPRRVFVNSMSDLFHEDVPSGFIRRVFWTMRECRDRNLGHTFQILTKRPERMLGFCREVSDRADLGDWTYTERGGAPLENVWLGVSVENQKYADERIPLLLQTPAAVRFLSVEPQLEAISFRWAKWDNWQFHPRRVTTLGKGAVNELDGLRMLDWVICGGESGPGARPFDVEWAETLLGQCKAAAVPFFMKQLGAYARDYGSPMNLRDRKGGDPEEWPEHLRVREFPER